MNPELPSNPREELELRVTSLLLGELSGAEAASVRASIANDPELQKLHDDLKQTIHLVREATVNAGETAHEESTPLKLSEERRQSLMTAFIIPPLKPEHIKVKRERQWFVPVAAVATILAVLGVWMFVAPRREQEGYLAFNAERESLATAQPRRVTPLSGKRPEDGRESGDRVQVSGQVAMTTVSGRAAKTSDRSYSPKPQSEPTVVTALPAEPRLALPPPEIVLPKSGEVDGDALQVAGTSGFPAGNDFFAGEGQGGGGAGGNAPDFRFYQDKNRNGQWFDHGSITAGPQNQGEEMGHFKNLREAETTGKSVEVVAGNRVHVAGAVVGGGPSAQEPNNLQKALSATTISGYVDTSAEWSLKQANEADVQKRDGFNMNVTKLPVATMDESSSERGGVALNSTGTVRMPVVGDMPVVGHLFGSQSVVSPATTAPAGQPESALNKSGTGTLTVSGANFFTGGTVVSGGTLTVDGDKSKAEVLYDDPGQFIPQAQSASSGAGGVGLPVTAQLPVPHDRVKPVEKPATTGAYGMNVVGYLNVDQEKLRALDLPAATNSMGDAEWVGSLEPTSKPKDASNKFVARFAYVTPSDSQSLARGKRESNIVLPGIPAPAKPSASDSVIAVGQLEVNRSSGDDVADLGGPSNLGEESKRIDLRRAKETRPYDDKKRELDQLLAFQKILEQRVAMEKVDMALPRSGMVTIMNRAVAPAAADPGVLGSIGHALKGDYQATASIELDRPSADIAELAGKRMSGTYDPYFIQTEFEAIKSEAVLTNVITLLDLNKKWSSTKNNGQPLKTSETLDMLRRRLELDPVRGTTVMKLHGKSSDPAEAATIANAVAEAYRDYRLAKIRVASESGIRALEKSFVEQREKVKKVTQELAILREGTKPGAPTPVIDAPLPRKPATNSPVPQAEILTSENNFSTFSLNVSDVSFKLAAASLEKGQMPDSASIRSEEFINAFDYRDPEPKWDSASSLSGPAGKMPAPLAFAWERARYPFAHNRDLLRFSLKTAAAGRQAGRPLNVVLLLDNSGSMERADRVGIIREALGVLAKQLQPQDKLSVITFARTPRLVADGITGDKAGEVAERVSGLTPEGGTNLEDAMNLAYQTAAKHFQANGINRVVVLTDGAANLGNVEPESLKQKVEAQRKQGIALDCFGIGWEGFNDDLLEVLSRNGDGRYGFINSPEEAASEFAGQLAGALKVAASDVKVQVEFNPKRVTSYRQIGYAKHQLTKEQFRDNTVDAAEIAAQEAGNALYTVEVNPAGEGPLATVHVRYKIPGTTDYREQAWDVPFNGNAVALEQSSPAMRLATTASAFSEWLAVNPFAGEIAPDALLNNLSGVPEAFGADPRPKKLEWMIRQAKSLERK